MQNKKNIKKKAIGKKIMQNSPIVKIDKNAVDKGRLQAEQEDIIRQFHVIQKGYSRLMVDVAKEISLLRNWIGSQAFIKTNHLKSQINSRLVRN